MINEAEKFADDDKKVKEKVEARNELGRCKRRVGLVKGASEV